ncbi:deaminase domain-containing protein [Bacillus cereus]|uniref:deaminase domain-containing protein n=1 Tax=Bacillus cereus TaxID=1396 RepID=UPI001E52D85C|nr:deaminase domain-containing protein [Bacillus cereus]MCC2458308.1 hypothetical protein [Bacillus cereus]
MSSKRSQNKLNRSSRIKKTANEYIKLLLGTAIQNNVISKSEFKRILLQHNMAYAEYDVDIVSNPDIYEESGRFISHSKVSTRHKPENPLIEYGFLALKTEGRVLKHIDVGKAKNIECNGSHPRQGDSEAKILEKLAEIFVQNSVGIVHLYTQYEPCLSCDYEIIQFLGMFPQIELIINYDLDYN